METQTIPGQWRNSFPFPSNESNNSNQLWNPSKHVMNSTIHRSWTICDPFARRRAPRKSPEFGRLYSSLPINHHQDKSKYLSRTHRQEKCSNSAHIECIPMANNCTARTKCERYHHAEEIIAVANSTYYHENEAEDDIGVSSNSDVMVCSRENVISCKTSGDINNAANEVCTYKESSSIADETTTQCNHNADAINVNGKVQLRKMVRPNTPSVLMKERWLKSSDGETNANLLPHGDDYQLVFISSDSSSKEEDVDNDSSSNLSLEDCDWDYFEPNAGALSFLRKTCPSAVPSSSTVQLDGRNFEPSINPSRTIQFYENNCHHRIQTVIRESTHHGCTVDCIKPSVEPVNDTNTDDDDDDDDAGQHRVCETCKTAVPKFIPVPIPVPVPYPMPTMMWPMCSEYLNLPAQFTSRLKEEMWLWHQKLWTSHMDPAFSRMWPPSAVVGTTAKAPELLSSSYSNSDYCDSVELSCAEQKPDLPPTNSTETVVSDDIPTDSVRGEHVACITSSKPPSTTNNKEDVVPRRKPSVHRSYKISIGDCNSDDESISVNDATDCCSSIVDDDELGASDSSSTGSNVISDVARKRRVFSEFFVPKSNYSTTSESGSSSAPSCDSSDNDTDTELDCAVQLTSVRHLRSADEIREGSGHHHQDHQDTNGTDVDPATCNSNGMQCERVASERGDFELNRCEWEQQCNSSCCSGSGSGGVDGNGGAGSSTNSSVTSEWNKVSAVAATNIRRGAAEEAVIDGGQVGTGEQQQQQHCGEEEHYVDVERQGECDGNNASDTLLPNSAGSVGGSARYTSLVMITQEARPPPSTTTYQPVSIVTSGTTTVVPQSDVIVRHTNWQEANNNGHNGDDAETATGFNNQYDANVTVITSGETLSAFEEGLADDDSWVENLSHEDEDFGPNSLTEGSGSSSGEEVTLTCTAALGLDDRSRSFHRSAIDFTLHTIVEESCEDSEVEQSSLGGDEHREPLVTDLEKYFFFKLGDGASKPFNCANTREVDVFSDSSSLCSEDGQDSLGDVDDSVPPTERSDAHSPSRLEKYFLSGFMGFSAERKDSDSSVGSDSEGKPSPEQRRKKHIRGRGTARLHSSTSNDNNFASHSDGSNDLLCDNQNLEKVFTSDSDTCGDTNTSLKSDEPSVDSTKKKKLKKLKHNSCSDDPSLLDILKGPTLNLSAVETDCDSKTGNADNKLKPYCNLASNTSQHSRDSGFVGSCDDLLKDQQDSTTHEMLTNHSADMKKESKANCRNGTNDINQPKLMSSASPLVRKDSFNNWSSDEETNLMMCKMRQFFKTMVANSNYSSTSKSNASTMHSTTAASRSHSSPPVKNRCKPPQLIYFENELTRLMKTVPGLRDEQVREIVEYLSSEDTWSDSYDSSDYTSSDLECSSTKCALQKEISDSCREIIDKFESGDSYGGDAAVVAAAAAATAAATAAIDAENAKTLNQDTTLVYQELFNSFEKIAIGDCSEMNKQSSGTTATRNSPPLVAKVMHHIGSRLVALMHEVSSSDNNHSVTSPKSRHFHRRLQQKLSSTSTTTTEDDDSTPDTKPTDQPTVFEQRLSASHLLSRSRSHDLLMAENRVHHQSNSAICDVTEERDNSDYDHFSWRGSFESALLVGDSHSKLPLVGIDSATSQSTLALAAKRRSAGDLLFNQRNASREQLDRVRSCGSIGGSYDEDPLWTDGEKKTPRRHQSNSLHHNCVSGDSADGEDDDDDMEASTSSRSTLPRSLQSGTATTNSLPRLPTNSAAVLMQKTQSMGYFVSPSAKSARYRPPGYNRPNMTVPKRALSAPGLQPNHHHHHHQRRAKRHHQSRTTSEETSKISEALSSPFLSSKSATHKNSSTPNPVSTKTNSSHNIATNTEWSSNSLNDDSFPIRSKRGSLTNLGLQTRSDSMISVYSGAGEGRYGNITVRGQVEFGLQYDYKVGALEILVKQCRDLAAADPKRQRSDPYVKVYLLPDKSKSGKRKTKVKKHTLSPVFEDTLKFHVPLNSLECKTLWLSVWHSDIFGRNDFLGEVLMPLENKVFDNAAPLWYILQERSEPLDDMVPCKGDIIVCLKFVPPDVTTCKKGKPSRGALNVLVKEAKNLTAVKTNGTSEPFCKSYLLPDKGRNSKQKTPVVRRTINPVWNHNFVYNDITLQELTERSLELTVWDHDRLSSNEFLGGVRFSLGTGKHYGKDVDWMDATGKECSLWKSMLDRPNFWVEGCLSLRSTLDNRNS